MAIAKISLFATALCLASAHLAARSCPLTYSSFYEVNELATASGSMNLMPTSNNSWIAPAVQMRVQLLWGAEHKISTILLVVASPLMPYNLCRPILYYVYVEAVR